METRFDCFGSTWCVRRYLVRQQPIFFFLLIGCVLLALMGAAKTQRPSGRSISRGASSTFAREADEAIIEFRNTLQVAPQFAEAHSALGRAYRRRVDL